MTDKLTGGSENHLWLQVLPKDYVLKDSNGNCYLAFIMNKIRVWEWEFGTSMMTGYYTIFNNQDEYVAFSILPDSQKKAPGSITNKNFNELSDGKRSLSSFLGEIFLGIVKTLMAVLYALSMSWILDLSCYLLTFSWWTNICNFYLYKTFTFRNYQ